MHPVVSKNVDYRIDDVTKLNTPALIVFVDHVQNNVKRLIATAGDATRLRPHCKTHKIREIVEFQLERGITKHKAATFAEAEMQAEAGAKDILLAYNMVGPNVSRAVQFSQTYPDVQFMVTADNPQPIERLGQACVAANTSIEVLLDIDTGLHRTGISAGPLAQPLYELIVNTAGIEPGGFHVYDGHQHQQSLEERQTAVRVEMGNIFSLRDTLLQRGWPVPRMVCGGSPTFPVYAEMDDPAIELSPGTPLYWDEGYGQSFPDMKYTPAAGILTRVISQPVEGRLTLDAGTKSVASDPPKDRRLLFPKVPDADILVHNEEHLVIQTARAGDFQPGDALLGIPWHICPTSVLYPHAVVIRDGKTIDRWTIAARDRQLTI